MKKSRFLFYAIVLIWLGCDTIEESVSTNPSLQLTFSTDTVSFDTLLSEKKSSTRRLSVYNPNNSAINLSSVFLNGGQNSDYSLIINGKSKLRVENEIILGGDSILILIDVNVTERDIDLPYLVSDEIVFEWNGNVDDVKLVSYGQDGIRFSNRSVCTEIWTNDRPYILSGTLLVGEGCELTIEEGTRIYFENDASLFIRGKLTALGDPMNRITFTNSRFDGIFDQVPGQWNGIYFLEGSHDNKISYADIFNAQVGLRVGTPDDNNDPDLIVANTRIYNMSNDGILAFTSDINVSNCLIYNCGRYLVGNFAGGNYNYTHCTISNDQSLFISEEEFVQFSDNLILEDGQILSEDLSVSLVNNIIWGSGDNELVVRDRGEARATVSLHSNIIRSTSEIENNFTSTAFNFPGFKSDYTLDTLAFAKDKGIKTDLLDDIVGNQRDDKPDIGAFERIEN
ncbi:MAG: hypothetical protein GDA37_11245 [Ekhidna sp.]|nr:hypothetical protein [Ekhidna sp.]